MNTDVMFSSKTDLWATPQNFFDKLNNEFYFTLDPCSNDENHKCDLYFTKDDNGLSLPWDSYRVFCNPPYGSEISLWVKKCYEEVFIYKRCQIAVMLIPSRTDTRWFHDFIYGKAEIRFVRGRLKFGDAKNSAPFPSMVVIFRLNSEGKPAVIFDALEFDVEQQEALNFY